MISQQLRLIPISSEGFCSAEYAFQHDNLATLIDTHRAEGFFVVTLYSDAISVAFNGIFLVQQWVLKADQNPLVMSSWNGSQQQHAKEKAGVTLRLNSDLFYSQSMAYNRPTTTRA